MFDWRETAAEELEAGRYRISWRLSGPLPARSSSEGVEIFVGDRPDAIDRDRVHTTDASGRVEIEVAPGPRHYFALVTSGARPHLLSARRVALEGASNFRDLGGYYATGPDGIRRQVQWGRLYRSAHLNAVTGADQQRMLELGIGRVFDFRTERERSKRPNALSPAHAAQVTEVEIDPGSAAGFSRSFSRDGLSEDAMLTAMRELNRSLVRDHAREYQRMFRGLLDAAEESCAYLIQCASGKDRTGVGAMLILLALGVDREAIVHDYLLTNRYLTRDDQFARALQDIGGFDSSQLTPPMLRAIFEVRKEYAAAALDEIDDRFDGTDAYLEQQIGLTSADRTELKRRFLAR